MNYIDGCNLSYPTGSYGISIKNENGLQLIIKLEIGGPVGSRWCKGHKLQSISAIGLLSLDNPK